ncbi:MAG: preprotein translocase subunit SecG [Synergistaceae bacterium]|jgi:preprotein translocase subunit SecG|nr:preprotein translocase subunit SecG [Synergistaceae bacterium]
MGRVLAVLFMILCVVIIVMVFMQHRKSGGFSGSFGGGGTQMDASGGSWQRMSALAKITWGLVAVFMVLSFILVRIKL